MNQNTMVKKKTDRGFNFSWNLAKTILEGNLLEVEISPWFGNIKIYHNGGLVDFVGASPVRYVPPKQATLKIGVHKIKVVNPPGFFTKPIIFIDGTEARLI